MSKGLKFRVSLGLNSRQNKRFCRKHILQVPLCRLNVNYIYLGTILIAAVCTEVGACHPVIFNASFLSSKCILRYNTHHITAKATKATPSKATIFDLFPFTYSLCFCNGQSSDKPEVITVPKQTWKITEPLPLWHSHQLCFPKYSACKHYPVLSTSRHLLTLNNFVQLHFSHSSAPVYSFRWTAMKSSWTIFILSYLTAVWVHFLHEKHTHTRVSVTAPLKACRFITWVFRKHWHGFVCNLRHKCST